MKVNRIFKRIKQVPSYLMNVSWSWLPSNQELSTNEGMGQPVLILSLPRSGSSWVGEVLSQSSSVCYLREPITQTYVGKRPECSHGNTHISTVFSLNYNDNKQLFDKTFFGIPRFRLGIITNPVSWNRKFRQNKTLVIKEVNPMGCFDALSVYNPKVVFLTRHPAAVASSFRQLGWFNCDDWYGFGKRQGAIIKQTKQLLDKHGDYLFIKYEDLAESPITQFQKIYSYLNIKMDSNVLEYLESSTKPSTNTDPYHTSRDSKKMKDVWKHRVSESELIALENGYHSEHTSLY